MEEQEATVEAVALDSGRNSPKRHKRDKKHKSKDAQKYDKACKSGERAAAAATDVALAGTEESEDWEANRKGIEALCMRGPNYICADCGEVGTHWASVNHGVFVCIRCSGVHRALGVHVSKVKSTNMDKWTAAEVALMAAIGNKRGKTLYEARLGSTRPPSSGSSDGELRSFLERKYEQREFAVENLGAALKKVYKQVGYGKYKRAAGDGAGDQRKGNAGDGVPEDGAETSVSHASAKTLREEAMRAFYGDGAAAGMSKKKKKQPTEGVARDKAARENEEGGSCDVQADGDRHKGRRGKTIHGTFGVVNVSADIYDERLRAVLAAFGVEEAAAPSLSRETAEATESTPTPAHAVEPEGSTAGSSLAAAPVADAAVAAAGEGREGSTQATLMEERCTDGKTSPVEEETGAQTPAPAVNDLFGTSTEDGKPDES